jgi:hypothetical protein
MPSTKSASMLGSLNLADATKRTDILPDALQSSSKMA